VGSNNGVPIRIKDIGDVVIGNAPRLASSLQKNDERSKALFSCSGRTNAKCLKDVEAKTES